MQQQFPHTDDAVMQLKSVSNSGHCNPCTFRYMPVAVPALSQSSTENVAQEVSVESNAQDIAEMFVEDELLTEQCLEMFADCEDDDCMSGTENDNVGNVASVDVKKDGSNLPVQEKNSHVSMKNNTMLVSPKQPITVHSRFKQKLSYSKHYHPISNTSLSSVNANPNALHDVISPEPGHFLRKRPGQSIYKAPGAQTG